MKKEELQKAWQEVQDRLGFQGLHIDETVSSFLEEKNHSLLLLLTPSPAAPAGKNNDRDKK
jgi:hypothetical protein